MKSKQCMIEVDEAEAMAIKEGLVVVIEMRFTHLQIETDSLQISSIIKSKKENRSLIGMIVQDIINLSRHLREVNFTRCKR